MGDVKTITKIPVGAAALMGAAIYAVLGLIGGTLQLLASELGPRLSPLQLLQEWAARLPPLSEALLAGSLAATS